MTFLEYIADRPARNNPAGDFILDARADSQFPNAESWQQLHSYMISVSACEGAIDAARTVWAGYRAKLRRKQKVQPHQ